MIPDQPPKPIAYIVPKGLYVTGMTARDASVQPGVLIVHEADLSMQALEAYHLSKLHDPTREPLVLVSQEREVREVHVLDYPVANIFTIPPRRPSKPEMSRHDLNPRKGRR